MATRVNRPWDREVVSVKSAQKGELLGGSKPGQVQPRAEVSSPVVISLFLELTKGCSAETVEFQDQVLQRVRFNRGVNSP